MAIVQQAGSYKNVTATATIALVPGNLLGFYVNSTSSGTIAFKDGGQSSGVAIGGTITPAIGWHCYPAACVNGCSVLVAATLDVTIFFAAG